jgi:AraC-like DNA-binding protein
MHAKVDSTEYILNNGDCLLIFPNQVHELITPNESDNFIFIFSQNLVQAYSSVFNSKIPKSNVFHIEEGLRIQLMGCDEGSSIFKIKGLLYSLISEFDSTASYADKTGADRGLLYKIFSFVENNYRSGCTLDALASETSYHYVYLSRFFKQTIGISFTEYVLRYKISEAAYLLKNRSITVAEAACDSGFDSLRSFNRNFKRIIGVTPTEYRDNV